MPGSDIALMQCQAPTTCEPPSSADGDETVIELSGSDLPYATTSSAIISDPSFGFAENNTMALVELPNVNIGSRETKGSNGPSNLPFYLSVRYDVPQASAYDWSSPPLSSTSSEATWEETIPVGTFEFIGEGTSQAQELIGTDHAAAAADNLYTLISGVLLGVAGAAALTALVEFLHLILGIK